MIGISMTQPGQTINILKFPHISRYSLTVGIFLIRKKRKNKTKHVTSSRDHNLIKTTCQSKYINTLLQTNTTLNSLIKCAVRIPTDISQNNAIQSCEHIIILVQKTHADASKRNSTRVQTQTRSLFGSVLSVATFVKQQNTPSCKATLSQQRKPTALQ